MLQVRLGGWLLALACGVVLLVKLQVLVIASAVFVSVEYLVAKTPVFVFKVHMLVLLHT